MELFPDLTELSELSDEQLDEELSRIIETADKIGNGDEDVIGEMTDEDVDEALARAVEQAESIRAEQAERAEAAEQTEASINEKLSKIKGESDEATDDDKGDPEDKGEGEGESEDDEPKADADDEGEEAEELAASGAAPKRRNTRTVLRRRAPARRPAHDPTGGVERGFRRTLVAGGNEVDSALDVAAALSDAINRTKHPTRKGVREEVVVASILLDLPEDVSLTAAAGEAENTGKIQKVLDYIQTPEAQRGELLAGGGICAPVDPYYELADFGVTDRPVRDALPRFGADRGGIRFATPLTLADINNAVWYRTAAQDAAGYVSSVPTAGGTPDKTVQRVTCPTFNEVQVAMIGTSIVVGQLPQRTFPELIQHFQRLVAQAAARVAEGKLLDRIAANSKTPATAVTQTLGLVDYVGFILRQAAAIRSRQRMSEDQALRLIAPRWLEAAWDADQIRGNRFVRDEIETLLAEDNIRVTWYLDSEASGGQVMAAQATGGTTHWTNWPANAISYLFPEGSYLFLDGGQINLGVIIDSVLAKTNDSEIFAESLEELAFLGSESLRLVTPVCPSGASAAAVAYTCGQDIM